MTDPSSLVGQPIGQYQVMQHLARGGMADVYLALDTDLQRQVVLKVLLPNFAQDVGFVERFRREAQAMAQLHHPNVVQVYAIGTTGNRQPYIAMQYVPEGTLAEKLTALGRQQQILTTPYALALARQVADALAAAHRKGIVHRDLKPSNILLDANGKPLLTDLGIAVVESNPRLTQTNVLLGTPHYMSPEQVKGESVDGRTDIYALGIILYELFAGMRPFTADGQWGVLHKQIYEEARPLQVIRPDLPSEVVAIVARCMQKAPEERYQSAEELVGALDQTLQIVGAPGQQAVSGAWLWQPPDTGKLVTGGSKIVPPPPSTVVSEPAADTLARPRRRWSYALLLLLLLPVCAFGGWQVWLRTQMPPTEIVTPTPDTAVVETTPVEQIPVVDIVDNAPTNTAVSSTPTQTSVPTALATAVSGEIELLRPNDETFTLEDEVQFSWRWPEALTAEQFFTLYFTIDGEEMRAMSVDEPAAGTLFRLQFVLSDILQEPGVYRWFVRLEADDVADPLLESDSQELTVEAVAEATVEATTTQTATSTTPPPTSTATRRPTTSTPRPTNTAVPPTATAIPPTAVPPTAPPPTSPPPTSPPPTAVPPTAPPPTSPPPTPIPPTAVPPTNTPPPP